MWNLKNKTDEETKQNRDKENKQVVAWREAGGGKKEIGEVDLRVPTSSCKINESLVWNVQCGEHSEWLFNISCGDIS